MKPFSGKWSDRLTLLFISICGFGAFYFMVVLAIQRALEWPSLNKGFLFVSIPLGIMGLVFSTACLYGIFESFTIYQIDKERIERKSLFKPQSMLWAEVSTIKTRDVKNSDIEIADHNGKKMTIRMSLVDDRAMELRGFIDKRLADLCKKQKQNLIREKAGKAVIAKGAARKTT